uniref:E3 ubiquitin-protein ligase n=1 Tax=Clastoptera arizonana TaxID=38151 RepID=A0A1B6DYP8_9HEMI
MLINLKCRKCRFLLLCHPEATLINIHGEPLDKMLIQNKAMNTLCTIDDVFYLDEVGIPEWIVNHLNEKDWLRGKLNCPNCLTRLGSFNFVTGYKCSCQKVVPPIHIVKSKVDIEENQT